MNFLADTDALIVDLRKNGGGDPAMVALLCSYFFGVESVHLNDIYFRPDDSTQQYWTSPFVPGRKYTDKDVYVLTSGYTFSGAEDFANNLKTLKRATIVGETTGGGANPGGMERLHDHFAIFVPSGRAINPITKSNWDGTGVEPDVKVSAELALQKAHAIALEKLMGSGSDPDLTEERKQTLERLQSELSAVKLKNV
jgi:C-terminal processing protease CtpA/Prc